MKLSLRQRLFLEKVVEGYVARCAPVGSKWLAQQSGIRWGPSTIRAELAALEEMDLLAHPHTSAGRVPTEAGYRSYVNMLLEYGASTKKGSLPLDLKAVKRELELAMRKTAEVLSRVTDLLAVVSAPPLRATTIRHIEVLLLEPKVVMVVVITSTGGVTKRVFTFSESIDPGLADWAASYMNELLCGMSLGALRLESRLDDPGLTDTERRFVSALYPAFTELEEQAANTLYMDGARRLLEENRFEDISELNDLMGLLERRVRLLKMLRSELDESRVYLRIGRENEVPELHSASVVAANYGLGYRNLGTVGVIGPMRMDYKSVICSVEEAAASLSRFVEDLYHS